MRDPRMEFIGMEPTFESLRSDSRFIDLLRRLNLFTVASLCRNHVAWARRIGPEVPTETQCLVQSESDRVLALRIIALVWRDSAPKNEQLVHVATRISPFIGVQWSPTILDKWSVIREQSRDQTFLACGLSGSRSSHNPQVGLWEAEYATSLRKP